MTITPTQVGITKTVGVAVDFIPGCVADFVTTNGMHTYRVHKYAESHVEVYADDDLLFLCPYDELDSNGQNRALLLATSTPGESKFMLDYMDYTIGALSFIQDDCNTNSVLDTCETSAGTAPDCNTNAIPDGCELAGATAADCNTNSVPDVCELAAASAADCNTNGWVEATASRAPIST